MSNYHIMKVSPNAEDARVAFHIAVPDEVNFSGVSLATAVQKHLEGNLGSITSSYPNIDAGELTQIQAGEIYERIETVRLNVNLSNIEKRNIVDARYNSLAISIPNRLREEFKFWGLDRDVS